MADRAGMTAAERIALCESRINGLSCTRQAFEHTGAPEHVDGLIDDLRVAASAWDTAVSGPPDGDPVALRVGARTVRNGVPGFGAVADAIEAYASTLESGQARHAAGLSRVRAAQRDVAQLPRSGDAGPGRTGAASMSATAVLDAACAGYAACQDAYEAVRQAEAALYTSLAHVRARQPGRRSGLSI